MIEGIKFIAKLFSDFEFKVVIRSVYYMVKPVTISCFHIWLLITFFTSPALAQDKGNALVDVYAPNLAEFILVGERHGVEQQQLVLAALLNEISKSDKKVGVIMEMISADQVKLYETFRKLSQKTPKDFGYAIGWGKTSWPDYKYYAPIFEIIWARDMALVPGDPPSAAAGALAQRRVYGCRLQPRARVRTALRSRDGPVCFKVMVS